MSHVILPSRKQNKGTSGNVGRAEFRGGLDAIMAELHNLINRHSSTLRKPITPAEVEQAKQGFKKGMANLEKSLNEMGVKVEKGKPKPVVEKGMPPMAGTQAGLANLLHKSTSFDLVLDAARSKNKAKFNGKEN